MRIQDVIKKIKEADLKPEEAQVILAYLIGYLGDDTQDYNMEKVVTAFEEALNYKNENYQSTFREK